MDNQFPPGYLSYGQQFKTEQGQQQPASQQSQQQGQQGQQSQQFKSDSGQQQQQQQQQPPQHPPQQQPGLIVGRPPAEELGGMEVEVDEGYIIEDDDMAYGFCAYDGGPMALAGDTCE